MECIREHARVVVHFHPDRLGTTPTSVAEALLEGGLYRNQFETGRSSGGLAPSSGGPRDSWERVLFGRAYQMEGVSAAERPKYGALELIRFPDGPIPRFGSCYLVLRPTVSSRTSFTFAGSEDPLAPERLGLIDGLDSVMAALFAEIEAGAMATPPWPPFRAPTLGVPDLTIARLLDLVGQLANPRPDPNNLRARACARYPDRSAGPRPDRVGPGCRAAGRRSCFHADPHGRPAARTGGALRFSAAVALRISHADLRRARRFSWSRDASSRATHYRRRWHAGRGGHRCGRSHAAQATGDCGGTGALMRRCYSI